MRSGQISCKSPGNGGTYVTDEPGSETSHSSVVSEKNGCLSASRSR